MAFWENIMARLSAGVKAFREPDLISNITEFDTDFNTFAARRLRYDLHWAFYENTHYRDIHQWANAYRVQFGLYRYTRGIYNPTYRLGEFWKSHLWGGSLFVDDDEPTMPAIPIETENETLLPIIEYIWQVSNWQVNKDVCSLYGSIFGDVAIKVIDDTSREKVYLDIIHPGSIAEVDKDPFGNVKAYSIQEFREHPFKQDRRALYTEKAYRDGDNVVYQTFLDDGLYDWSGNNEPEWIVPYGFIPMTIIQHNNVGAEWGWAELQPGRNKIHEIDDIASKLDDQIRKAVDAPWFFTGIKAPQASAPQTARTTNRPIDGQAYTDNPDAGREQVPALYAELGGDAKALVADLDITAVSEHLKALLLDLEEDYPELRSSTRDGQGASGEKSGKAIREARRNAERKVIQRRPNYDDALVRAQQMAIAIGGYRGYPEFQGFSLDSFAAGQLDHSIKKRPVFAVDPLDEIEIQQAKTVVLQNLVSSGASIQSAAIIAGFTDEQAALLAAIEIPQNEAR